MRSFFICGFVHVDNRCGHVSIALFGHRVQFGFGYVSGQKIFFRWLPMYWEYRNFNVCVICASDMPAAFQKWLESL